MQENKLLNDVFDVFQPFVFLFVLVLGFFCFLLFSQWCHCSLEAASSWRKGEGSWKFKSLC